MATVYAGTDQGMQQRSGSVPSCVQDLAAAAAASGSAKHAHLSLASSHHEHTPDGGSAATPLVTYGDSLADAADQVRRVVEEGRPVGRPRWTVAEVEAQGLPLVDEAHREPLAGDAEEGEPDPAKARKLRAARFEALRVLWEQSTLPGVRGCRRSAIDRVEGVQVRQRGDAVGLAGLRTCGSVWACPVCSARIQAERRAELVQLVRWASENGFVVAFGTYTLRHRQGQPLVELLDAVQGGYRAVGQARGPRRVRAELGYIGQVRAVEVTFGQNGWHPHLHTVLIFEGPLDGDVTQGDLDRLADAEFSVWQRQAVRRGLGAPRRERWELKLISPDEVEAVGEYLGKAVYRPPVDAKDARAVGFELQAGQTKTGKRGSRTPWQLLESVVKTGDADDLDLWLEYEQATRGRQALVWSQGLKQRALVSDRTDEEVAGEEIGSAEDTLFTVPDWTPFSRDARLIGELLNAVSEGGKLGGLTWCSDHGIRAKEHRAWRSGSGGGGSGEDDG